MTRVERLELRSGKRTKTAFDTSTFCFAPPIAVPAFLAAVMTSSLVYQRYWHFLSEAGAMSDHPCMPDPAARRYLSKEAHEQSLRVPRRILDLPVRCRQHHLARNTFVHARWP